MSLLSTGVLQSVHWKTTSLSIDSQWGARFYLSEQTIGIGQIRTQAAYKLAEPAHDIFMFCSTAIVHNMKITSKIPGYGL